MSYMHAFGCRHSPAGLLSTSGFSLYQTYAVFDHAVNKSEPSTRTYLLNDLCLFNMFADNTVYKQVKHRRE